MPVKSVADSPEARLSIEDVDWVLHAADTVLSTTEIEARVAEFRRSGTRFRDTVPDWDPPLPWLCDL